MSMKKNEKINPEEQARLDWLTEIAQKVEEEKVNYGGPHCCLVMDSRLQDPIENILYYDPVYRKYWVQAENYAGFILDFCPACGKKLSKCLRDEWFESVKNELGIENPLTMDRRKLTKEFKTDAWWKKRGL